MKRPLDELVFLGNFVIGRLRTPIVIQLVVVDSFGVVCFESVDSELVHYRYRYSLEDPSYQYNLCRKKRLTATQRFVIRN